MKILYVTTLGETFYFFRYIIKQLLDEGHTVDIATNDSVSKVLLDAASHKCRIYSLSWSRSPFSTENIAAIKKLKEIIVENKYDIVHCHTPIASACTRLSCRKLRKTGLKVIYTAHGFHFYKGASLKNWIIFYPVEWLCSFMTDVIITINQEDYRRAKKHFHSKEVLYVPGVGVEIGRFSNTGFDRTEKRKQLGLNENDFVILSVGELSERKNHQAVIQALRDIEQENCKYLIVGEGYMRGHLESMIETFGLRKQVFMLGLRGDVPELDNCADLFILPSLQEGLPVALMEAIAAKIPVMCSDIRGNTELVNKVQTFPPTDVGTIRKMINSVISGNKDCAAAFVEENFNRLQSFSIENVNRMMLEIYQKSCN